MTEASRTRNNLKSPVGAVARSSVARRGAARIAVVALALGAALGVGPARAATFAVTTTGDEDAQGSTSNGICNSTAGTCTLRAAIKEANGTTGTDTITFSIGAVGSIQTIIPATSLPSISTQVILDGWTQGGGSYTGPPLVVIQGPAGGANFALDLRSGSSGSTVRGLCIQGFTSGNGVAVHIHDSSDNVIVGNYLGTDVTGATAAANKVGVTIDGLLANSAMNNRIGGTLAAERNVISGNTIDGVQIFSANAINNQVQGNYIGLDATGTVDLGNANQGIAVFNSATNTTIGGGAPGAGNVVSGNDGFGIGVSSSSTGTIIQGNRIGTNAAGIAGIGNTKDGIFLGPDAAGNTIGGTTAGARNVISGNGFSGVVITGAASNNNVIAGNFIGTDSTGTVGIGNTMNGVQVSSANNTIGGTMPGAGNVISGNGGVGVLIDGVNVNNNVIAGNYVGTDTAGTGAIGNALGGVFIYSNSPSNSTIGGTAAGAGNRIAYNGNYGIAAGSGTGNAFLGNAIFANAGLGIDLQGDGFPQANDLLDLDGGPNNLQNHPVLTTAMTSGGAANIVGSLDSAPSKTYRVEFFASGAKDPTGYGEGERYLGFTSVATNAAGSAVVAAVLVTSLAPGEYVAATATECTDGATCATFGSTSEFGLDIQAAGSLVVTTTADTVDGNTSSVQNLIANPGLDGRISLREAIFATNNTPGPDTIRFGFPLTDVNHVYYKDNMGAGFGLPTPTTLADFYTPSSPWIADFDPDYPAGLARSWYRIQPVSPLPTIADTLLIDGTTQILSLAGAPVIEIEGALLGGTTPGVSATAPLTLRGLIIDQFPGEGVRSTAASTTIVGNYVGTDPSGTMARGNGRSGTNAGIYLGGSGSQVGGTAAADRNLISGNVSDGLWIDASGVTVQTNDIGLAVTGASALGNGRHGIVLQKVSSPAVANNLVGGATAGEGNRIAYNAGDGVSVAAGVGSGNAILGNAIHGNGGLGIDLLNDGVTLNDPLDADPGPNDLLNFPEATSTYASAGTVTVWFKLDVLPGSYRIEFFKNGVPDPTGYGEGETFAGSMNLTHPGGGPRFFSHSFAGNVGDWIAATTTFCADGPACASFGSTSEFGNAITIAGAGGPEADLALGKVADANPADLGSVLTYTLTVTNNGPLTATGVVVTDPLIPEMEFQSAAPSNGTCAFDVPTRTVICHLDDMLDQDSATVTLKVRPKALGTYENTAYVTRNEPDLHPSSDSASVSITVQVPSYGVRALTVTSTSGKNVVEWLNPSSLEYQTTELVVNEDHFPANTADGLSLHNAGVAGASDRYEHNGLTDGKTYYYAAFVHRSAMPFLSNARFCRGRPFDMTYPQPVKWAFSTNGFSVTPPTVGGAGIIATANDRGVYAMARGPLGGEWPKGDVPPDDDWYPFEVGGPVQSRSPVIPMTFGGANPVVFLGAQDGRVYALDGLLGGHVASPPWPAVPVSGSQPVQAAPAGIFIPWGGDFDCLLVGTRDESSDNVFAAIDPKTGGVFERFGGGGSGLGVVNGMAAVDYATKRVYFTTHTRAGGSASTLWCLRLTTPAGGPPATVFASCPNWTSLELGDIDSSPVLRGTRLYVGSGADDGAVYSVDLTDGTKRSFLHGDGQVKGFVFPDRTSPTGDLYFATENYVWIVSDPVGGPMALKTGPISLGAGVKPSAVLFVPASHFVYVGGTDGQLYEIDVATAAPELKAVTLGDGKATVGAPSYDREYDLVHVGTEAGVFYAVQVPLPPAESCVADCTGKPDGTPCWLTTAAECSSRMCSSAVCQ